jgi:hypothetical protein
MAVVASVIFSAFIFSTEAGYVFGVIGLAVIAITILLTYLKKQKLVGFLQSFIQSSPSSVTQLSSLVALTVLAWFCKLAALVLIVLALSELNIITALSGIIGSELGAMLPINGIAGAGSFEATFAAGSRLFEKFSAPILATAVNLHLFIFLSTTSIAIITLPIKRYSSTAQYTEASHSGTK